MFNLRFKLHKIVYNHRTSKAIDYMLMDILLYADSYFDISNSIFDCSQFMKMTDSILYAIEHSREPALEKSRRILHSLRKRELYKFVCELLVPSHIPDITEEEVTTHQNTPQVNLRPEDIIIQNMRANYAMREKNPVVSIYISVVIDKVFIYVYRIMYYSFATGKTGILFTFLENTFLI